MSIDVGSLLNQINFHKYKKIILCIVAAILLLFVGSMFIPLGDKDPKKPDMPFTIRNLGGMPALDAAMDENALLRQKIKQLMEQDVAYLFANYKQVNGQIAEIIFLWSGLTPEELKKLGGRGAIDFFLRRLHGLSDDEPVLNNPVLGERPWPRLFNRYKARIIMLGQGDKVYSGLVYYDSIEDRIIVDKEATLSKEFLEAFSGFLKTRPEKERKSYINNFLVFIDETKGLKNLTDQEKELLRALNN